MKRFDLTAKLGKLDLTAAHVVGILVSFVALLGAVNAINGPVVVAAIGLINAVGILWTPPGKPSTVAPVEGH